MKIKICGMKAPDNITAIEKRKPDFMGFIFYEPSPRYVGEKRTAILSQYLGTETKGVGVFVDEDLEKVQALLNMHQLKYVQLHGKESPEYCQQMKEDGFTIIKAFRVNESFDFSILESYKTVCDYFLFDTKGKTHGGTGKKFDWSILEKYTLQKPFFLSGGIGPGDAVQIAQIKHPQLFALDLNSRFEIEAGLKDINLLDQFFIEVGRNK